jgi:hypothetical protein
MGFFPLPPLDPEAEQQRIAAFEALVPQIFRIVAINLGDEKARELFAAAIRLKSGRPPAAKANAELVRIYDEELAKGVEELSSIPGKLAERLHGEQPGKYGLSPAAINKKIRRLLPKHIKQKEAATRFRGAGMLGDSVAGPLNQQSSAKDDEGHK